MFIDRMQKGQFIIRKNIYLKRKTIRTLKKNVNFVLSAKGMMKFHLSDEASYRQKKFNVHSKDIQV